VLQVKFARCNLRGSGRAASKLCMAVLQVAVGVLQVKFARI
jgi:hypothetical protein